MNILLFDYISSMQKTRGKYTEGSILYVIAVVYLQIIFSGKTNMMTFFFGYPKYDMLLLLHNCE